MQCVSTITSSWPKRAQEPISFWASVRGAEVWLRYTLPEPSPAKSSAMPWISPPPMSIFFMSTGWLNFSVQVSNSACVMPFFSGSW